MKAEFIALFITLVLFALISIGIIAREYSKYGAFRDENEPFFHEFFKKAYYLVTQKDPRKVAKRFGIDGEKYMYACDLVKVKAELERMIVLKVLGISILIIFFAFALLLKNIPFLIVGIVIGGLLVFVPGQKTLSDAEQRKNALFQELPRFLDLFQTALYINLPVEEAIKITAKNLEGTVLSEEFMDAMSDVKIGARSWQMALERISRKYDIDEFSDFVLDLILSYNKGLNIYEMVKRRNNDLKQTSLLTMRERAIKLSNTILLPISLFEILPLIGILMIPIILQLNATGIF